MLSIQKYLTVLGVALVMLSGPATFAQNAPWQQLHGHVPAAVSHLQPLGRVPATNHINLAIGLPLRNREALNNLLREIYDPASPNFRHYLTPEQFTEKFGPAEQDYQTLAAFMKANGFVVTATHPNRVVLDVNGSVADIERVFHVRMQTYRHPTESRNFYAPDVEPSIDLAVPILSISGLDNYSLPHPADLQAQKLPVLGANVTTNSGSGPNGTYMGGDFRAAYAPNVSLTGAGQVVGLLQFDGYYSNDIAFYETTNGLPSVLLINVPVDGGVSTPGSGADEVSLDIEMVISMAPGVSKIIVYEASTSYGQWPDLLNTIAYENLARQISCSWSGGSPNPTSEAIFQEMAAQGQSFFCASGDNDAFTSSIPFPTESTNITLVGGTTLSTTGPHGSYVSESVWNRGSGVGTGGGISVTYPIPVWQLGIDMTTNQGSVTNRNIPDVALTAENVWIVYGNGQSGSAGGTSCAAPLWAGFTALVNQQAATTGQPSVGFVNPAIYAIGKGTDYAGEFHDITTGNNFSSSSPARFVATNGFDLCTGWGTPAGQNLINTLAFADVLGVIPHSGFTANGMPGGPFDQTARTYTLTNNSSVSALNWSLINTSAWLSASSGGGTLAAGGQVNVTIGLNAVASNLVAGIYPAMLTFSNQTSHGTQNLMFVFRPGQSIVQNGGFEAGSFSSWTLVGNGITSTLIYNAVVNANGPVPGGTDFIHSGNYGAFLGDTQIATLSQTLNTLPGRLYLLSFWLDNPVSGSVQQFLVQWNTNSPAINQIYYLTNPPVLPWTNITFVVAATGTNTTLQFGAENDPNGFGLDDISVMPIPAILLQSVTSTNAAIQFTWNTLTGLVYQVQYMTNLLQTSWVNLGGPITAAGSTVTATNSIGPDSARYYRLKLVY